MARLGLLLRVRRPRLALALGLAASALSGTSCRIQSNAPYWIEAHGTAAGVRAAGWPWGVLLIGTDHQLLSYPGTWSNPWHSNTHARPLQSLAASNVAGYALSTDGTVARFVDNRWADIDGSDAWNAQEIGASVDDRVFAIVGGKLRLLRDGKLEPLACDAIDAVTVAGNQGEQAYVLDSSGRLFLNAEGRCDRISAPTRFRRLAAFPSRLVAVAMDGSVWRRRAGSWSQLPSPYKYRAGHARFATSAQDVALSAYSTWLVDNDGSVFLLSDES